METQEKRGVNSQENQQTTGTSKTILCNTFKRKKSKVTRYPNNCIKYILLIRGHLHKSNVNNYDI